MKQPLSEETLLMLIEKGELIPEIAKELDISPREVAYRLSRLQSFMLDEKVRMDYYGGMK